MSGGRQTAAINTCIDVIRGPNDPDPDYTPRTTPLLPGVQSPHICSAPFSPSQRDENFTPWELNFHWSGEFSHPATVVPSTYYRAGSHPGCPHSGPPPFTHITHRAVSHPGCPHSSPIAAPPGQCARARAHHPPDSGSSQLRSQTRPALRTMCERR